MLNLLEQRISMIDQVRNYCRQVSMTYQYELKLECANELGLKFDDVNLSYDQWSKLRSAWIEWRA